MKWNALILAGSRRSADDPVATSMKVSHKAFAPIHGKPMIEYVIKALQSISMIDEIAVSIEPTAGELPKDLIRLDAEPSAASSVLAAMDTLGTPLLVVTADNPLLDIEAVYEFMNFVEQANADVAAGVCPQHLVEKAGNPARRTYINLKDGAVSGCNLFAFKTPEARAAANFWRRLEDGRKKPWQMASQIGIGVLFKYAIGQLSRADITKHLSKTAGCEAVLVNVNHIYAAHDVDKPEDLTFAQGCLNNAKP